METELGLFEPVKFEPDAHTFIMKNVERNHRKKKKEEEKEAAAVFGNGVDLSVVLVWPERVTETDSTRFGQVRHVISLKGSSLLNTVCMSSKTGSGSSLVPSDRR